MKSIKAGFTVEAALLCPFLCLVICAMIDLTLNLYEDVDSFGRMVEERSEKWIPSTDMIRIEAVIEELL